MVIQLFKHRGLTFEILKRFLKDKAKGLVAGAAHRLIGLEMYHAKPQQVIS